MTNVGLQMSLHYVARPSLNCICIAPEQMSREWTAWALE